MKTIERPSQKLIDVVLKVAEGEARDKATPGMTYDGTATIFKLYHGWAEQQAALASLLPAAVKALEEIDKMMREIVGRHAHRENNALVIEGFTGCKADDASKLIQATLQRISEATKAVEGD